MPGNQGTDLDVLRNVMLEVAWVPTSILTVTHYLHISIDMLKAQPGGAGRKTFGSAEFLLVLLSFLVRTDPLSHAKTTTGGLKLEKNLGVRY